MHATIAGVLIGLMTPARRLLPPDAANKLIQRARAFVSREGAVDEATRVAEVRFQRAAATSLVSPTELLIAVLHPWVSFGIMPLFALANAGLVVQWSDLGAPIAVAAGLGLLLGKPIGIVLASFVAVRGGIAQLPDRVGWRQIVGGGFLSGIGFTMALFIAGLALEGASLDTAKLGVLAGSLLAGIVGMAVLSVGRSPAES